MQNPIATAPRVRPDLAPTSRLKWVLWVGGLALVLGLARYFHAQFYLRQALERISTLGPWGPPLFIGVYVIAAVLLIPGSVLTLGAGAIFGVVKGSIYVSIAATTAACASFLIGRHLAREAIARKIEGNPRFAAIDRAVAQEGWKIVGLTRLSPVFPFTLLNYAFGLTRVSFRAYALASWIGMMPGTLTYVYLGSIAQAVAGHRRRSATEWALYAVGLVATLIVTVVVTKVARKALQQKIAR